MKISGADVICAADFVIGNKKRNIHNIHILDRGSVRKYKIHIKRTENGNGREQRIKIVRHTKKILTLRL